MANQASDLITIDEVRKLLCASLGLKKLSRPSIYSWMKTRKLPPPIGFGIPRRWRKKQIEAWVEKQIKGQ